MTSTQLSLVLFGLLCIAAIPGTIAKNQTAYYHHPLFQVLLGCFALHLGACTVQRWRGLARSTLVVHLGVLVILAGGILTATGYVATVNVHEGGTADTVFRWDQERDLPLGMTLKVNKITRDFYPIPLKVGVLAGGEKKELVVTKTGGEFPLAGYTIRVDSFDPWGEVLRVTVLQGGKAIGTMDTSGPSTLPTGFPYSFKPVAFQNASIKRFWVDLQLERDGQVLARGVTELNRPFEWNGLVFYNTQIAQDDAGAPYAGIQIVRDPGKWTVFSGMFILSLGVLAAWYRRFNRR